MEIRKEDLEKLYLEEGKSCSKIAKILDVSVSSVHKKLKKYGIKTRKPKRDWLHHSQKSYLKLYPWDYNY